MRSSYDSTFEEEFGSEDDLTKRYEDESEGYEEDDLTKRDEDYYTKRDDDLVITSYFNVNRVRYFYIEEEDCKRYEEDDWERYEEDDCIKEDDYLPGRYYRGEDGDYYIEIERKDCRYENDYLPGRYSKGEEGDFSYYIGEDGQILNCDEVRFDLRDLRSLVTFFLILLGKVQSWRSSHLYCRTLVPWDRLIPSFFISSDFVNLLVSYLEEQILGLLNERMIFLKERPLLFAKKLTKLFSLFSFSIEGEGANLVRNKNQPVLELTPHLSLQRSKRLVPIPDNCASYGLQGMPELKGFDLGLTTTLPFTMHPFRFVGLRPLLSFSFHWGFIKDGKDFNYKNQEESFIDTSSLKPLDPLASVKKKPKLSPFKAYDNPEESKAASDPFWDQQELTEQGANPPTDHFLSLLEVLPNLLPKALTKADLHLFFEGKQRFGLEEFWLENSNLRNPSSLANLFRDDQPSKKGKKGNHINNPERNDVARLNLISLQKEAEQIDERSGVSKGFTPSILETRINLIIYQLGFWSSYFGNHSLTLTSVFSPYKGEVVDVPPLYSMFDSTLTKDSKPGFQTIDDRQNALAGQNRLSLLLTSTDQTSFHSEQSKPRVNVGQLIRCGEALSHFKNSDQQNDERSKHLTFSSSGQVIEIEKNKIKLRRAQPIPALLTPFSTSLYVTDGNFVKRDQPILTTFYQNLTTEDIVQGIPKIEQLFEARRTKQGLPFSGNLPDRLEGFFYSELEKPECSLKQAALSSLAIIQRILIDKIQNVYISQGVLIADKHLEIVVRQMTSKVVILADGFDDATLPFNRPWFLPGEFVFLEDAANLSAVIHPIGLGFFHKLPVKETLIYKPILLGVTTASLESESFFSSASFQETTRVLSSSSIKGQKDFLHGLKERVILGDLISVGTGSIHLIPSFSSPAILKWKGGFSSKRFVKVITKKTLYEKRLYLEGLNKIIDESVFALLENQISSVKKERRARILAIFAQRKIIVDQISKILSPIKHTEQARQQPIQEFLGLLGIKFDPYFDLKAISYLEQKQKRIERGDAQRDDFFQLGLARMLRTPKKPS